jgi:N-acetylglutamate synthase-like GNAT family acetyltransferase
MKFHIRRATPADAETLTEIAHAAKRHWGYPEHWIMQWQSDLTITADFINQNMVFVAEIDNQIAGCSALAIDGPLAEVEHMWVRPEYMGTGLGRRLFEQVTSEATARNLPELELSADPNAAGFYRHMGAVQIGEIPAEMDGQARVLPRMRIRLAERK